MPGNSVWRGRLRTARAIALLCLARFLVAFVPLRYWRKSLGLAAVSGGKAAVEVAGGSALRFAQHVERAAWRLPIGMKCLPQAMALSWLLRRKHIPHAVTIAVRPPDLRSSADGLHAWVEAGGTVILGELPGPWHVVFRIPENSSIHD